jgi:DNA-binding NtrC family response regulator
LGAELLQSTIAALVAKSALRQSLDHGTLLLNDVEEAPAEAQAELVKLLSAPTGPRIIATARESLARRVAVGEFRDDLACALGTLVIQLPPLAERRGDLPMAAQMFLEDLNGQGKKQLRGFAADALDALALYAWPGNLSELEQIVREAHARAEGFEVMAADLPKRIRLSAEAQSRPRRREEPINLEQFMGQVETELIRRALARSKGNKSKAAKLLGMTRPRLYRRMVQLGLAEDKAT